jgi:energy-coupling factor transporter ATP-binding protein EcfA2
MAEFARNLAFIIGIDNYRNGISPLRTATNDAKKLVEILREKHNYQVWVCLDEIATLKNLQQLLEVTLPQQVTSEDRLLLYFAGHGIALNGEDGPQGYLIPQDAVLGDTKTYLPMTRLQECLNQLPCRHFLGILDCCFAGAFRWSNTRDLLVTPDVIYQEHYNRFITDPAWQVITSAASDQKALDAFSINSERGHIGNHSLFAAALFDALEGAADIYPPPENGKSGGDGVITATELYLYLRDRLETPTEGYNQQQAPGIWALRKHEKGEYIFLNPHHPLNLPPAPELDESKNPYRGLQSFEEEHQDLFFGRDALVDKLHEAVNKNPLTVVLGASGSGKSSLVKAGLIPKLRKSTADKCFILPSVRPGALPFRALNNALTTVGLNPVYSQTQSSLSDSISAWATQNTDTKILLFIDQSEEIITLCQDDKQRSAFFEGIGQAVNDHWPILKIVLALRSDFEPQLRTVFQANSETERFIVPSMTRNELREAIEKPVEARVMYFDPHDMVEELIDEAAGIPGFLPLLSFALSELYLKYLRRQRQANIEGHTIDRAITKQDYQAVGSVFQSLTLRADEEYYLLISKNPAYEQTVKHVMLRMVALDGGLTRRRVPLSELVYPEKTQKLVIDVIERFLHARLLVNGTDSEENAFVEPTHDAVVMSWQRLRDWSTQEEYLRLQRRLTPTALEWKITQDKRFLWHNNPYLNILNEVLKSKDNNWLNAVETEFVERSIREKEGILGSAKNLWERFARTNRKSDDKTQSKSDNIAQEKVTISEPKAENLTDTLKEKTEETLSTSSSIYKRKIYALLVGIDNYIAPISSLKSCINDVTDVEKYLNERIADGYELCLRKLLNKEATRQAVIDGFRQHLCQAGDEDIAFFYFGGHGSQENAPEEFLDIKPSKRLNTLVCYDSRTEGIYDLSEPELAKLIFEVTGKSPHILTILDCDYSELDIKAFLTKCSSNWKQSVVNNLALPENVHHIMLSACRENELAREYNADGQTRGAFTYFLLKTLRLFNGKLTYQDLMRAVNTLVRGKVINQSPQLQATYSDDLDQLFLDGNNIFEAVPYFIVSHHREYGWIIDGGAIHSIETPTSEKTTLLALLPFPSRDSQNSIFNSSMSIGEAKVIEVYPSWSKVEINNNLANLSLENVFKTVVINRPTPLKRVHIYGSDFGVNLARQALQISGFAGQPSIYVDEVETSTGADFGLLCRDESYLIIRPADGHPLAAEVNGYTLENAKEVIKRLEHIARWTNIVESSSPATSAISPDDVKMDIIVSGQGEFESATYPNLFLEYEEDEDGGFTPPGLQIRLSNNSNKTLFCNVLALSERFAVSAPFFNSMNGVWLQPGDIVEGEYFSTTIRDELWEEGVTECKDILKLIVSHAEFDINLLKQGAVNDGTI